MISLVNRNVQGAPEKKISIPITRNPHYIPNAQNQVLKVNKKYKVAPTQEMGEVPLINFYNDTLYSGIIYVGTPPKPFIVDFDTGSSDFWLGTSLCSGCGNETVYNPFNSTSFSPNGLPWHTSYGDNSTSSGVLLYDTVDIGGITLTNLSIYGATEISASLNSPSTDGLLGLAFDSIATVPGIKTPFQEMVDRKLISSPIFSVYFRKTIDGGDDGGEYIFGGYNTSHIDGSLTKIPVNSTSGYWGIDMNQIKINGTSFLHKTSSAIVDTGTTLLVFPKKLALDISKHYNATNNGDGTFNISCNPNDLQPLDIELGSTTFTVPPDSLIFERHPNGCIAGFMYNDLDFTILGDVFIKNHYIIFNIEVPYIQIAPVK
ncbi:rhizopuspepsin 3 precursor [Backusella circina FSU 941]|nr:rhizopuspepsin 3 precursor [Backusella circina FSU 941]